MDHVIGAGFIPTFPATSPYITAVGGTTGSPVESAASFSGGGFSDRWDRPSWQADAVNGYLNSGTPLPAPDLWNKSGIGFPDVSAQGTNFQIVWAGGQTGVGGTSCSSPTFAGVISLINSARSVSAHGMATMMKCQQQGHVDQCGIGRLQAGKSTLGFLNPFLYENAGAFNDVTSGHNPGCGTQGFNAAKGWDPVTGLGTPNFPKLLEAALALP